MKKIFTVILMSSLLLTGCANKSEQTQDPAYSKSSASEVEVDSSTPTQEESSAESSEEAHKVDLSDPEYFPGIPGSFYSDIVVGLEQNGFPEDHDVGTTYCSNTRQVSADITMDYSIAKNRYYEVVSASFNYTDLNNNNLENVIDAASGYLSFCATMPYDTSDSDAARAFVEENIGSEDAELQIGDALFSIYTTQFTSGYTITLQVKYNEA